MNYDPPGMTATAAPATQTSDLATLDAVFSKVTRRFIPFLLLCFVGAFLDRVNISFAKLQMSSELGLSDAVYGFGAGIFFLGYFIFEVPSNILLHRIGARVWIARIMITWAIFSAAMIFVRSATGFYILRFLLGVAEAGFFPGIILFLSRWFPSARRGKVMALFMTGFPLAGMIGGPVSGWALKSLSGALGMAGWKWLFLIEAVPSFVLGIAAFFFLDDRLAEADWLNASEKAALEGALAGEQAAATHTSALGALTHARVWFLSAILFLVGVGMYGVVFWLPSLIKLSGVSDPLHIGLLSAIPNICGAAAMVYLGRSADRLRERRWHLALTGIVGAAGLVIAACWPHHTFIALFAITVAAMGIFPMAPIFWGIPAAMLAGVGAAAGIALINSIANLAGLFAPAVFGWIKEMTQSTTIGLLMFAAALCISSIFVLMLPRDVANR